VRGLGSWVIILQPVVEYHLFRSASLGMKLE
jgi:hypothetical protein